MFFTFFSIFFISLMSLKLWFKSFNLLHIPFSVFLSCSCFLFFLKKSLFFWATFLLFIFLFSTHSLTSFSSAYWFLFINTCFVMNTFIILRIFPQLFYFFFFFIFFLIFFFVLPSFKNDVKGPFQVKSSPFRRAINFKEDIWINVLKNCLILQQAISQLDVIFIAFFQKICHYLRDLWLEHIFPTKVKKILFFTNMFVKFLWHTLFPKHINHLVLVLII